MTPRTLVLLLALGTALPADEDAPPLPAPLRNLPNTSLTERSVTGEYHLNIRDDRDVKAELKPGALRSLKSRPEITSIWISAEPAPPPGKLTPAPDATTNLTVTPAALADLAQVPHLEDVWISCVDLSGPSDLDFFTKLPKLRQVRLYHCNVNTKRLLDVLRGKPDLEWVMSFNDYEVEGDWSVPKQVVTKRQVRTLVRNSPKLERFYFRTTDRFEPEGIAALLELQELNVVHLAQSIITTKLGARNVDDYDLPTTDKQRAVAQRLTQRFFEKGLKAFGTAGVRGTVLITPCLLELPTEPPK